MTARTPRGGDGKFIRTIKTAQRDFDAAELHAKGWSFERIAASLGFASRGHAHDAVTRALRDTPYEGAELDKLLDLRRIDILIERAFRVADTTHVTVSQGKIMSRQVGVERDDDGIERLDMDGKPIPVYEDIIDDAPILAAIREIRGLLKRRADIIGYDAPSKSRVEVVTQDVFYAALAQLEADVGANGADRGTPGSPAPVRGTPGAQAPPGR